VKGTHQAAVGEAVADPDHEGGSCPPRLGDRHPLARAAEFTSGGPRFRFAGIGDSQPLRREDRFVGPDFHPRAQGRRQVGGDHRFDILAQSSGGEKEGRVTVAGRRDQLGEPRAELRRLQCEGDDVRFRGADGRVDALDDRPRGELALGEQLLLQGEVVGAAEMLADLVADVVDRCGPVEIAYHRQVRHGAPCKRAGRDGASPTSGRSPASAGGSVR